MSLLNAKIMEDSSATPLLMDMIRIYEARNLIIAQGKVRFGPIPPEHEARLVAIEDLARMEALALRLLGARNWDDLLASELTT